MKIMCKYWLYVKIKASLCLKNLFFQNLDFSQSLAMQLNRDNLMWLDGKIFPSPHQCISMGEI